MDRRLGTDSNRIGQWCTSQRNTCYDLCGGRQYITMNTCTDVSLPAATSSCISTSRAPASLGAFNSNHNLSKHLLILPSHLTRARFPGIVPVRTARSPTTLNSTSAQCPKKSASKSSRSATSLTRALRAAGRQNAATWTQLL